MLDLLTGMRKQPDGTLSSNGTPGTGSCANLLLLLLLLLSNRKPRLRPHRWQRKWQVLPDSRNPFPHRREMTSATETGIVIWETPEDAKVPFLLKFNINTQFRYLNTLDSVPTFTDHLGKYPGCS